MPTTEPSFRILAISGSINAGATAARLLAAMAKLAGDGFRFTIFEGIGDIPHFNPQGADSTTFEAVLSFRALWKAADAAIICTPEYAFGMPGTLKNALDWLVGSGEVYNKPTTVLSYSPSAMGGEKALSTLLLTLTAQNAAFDETTTYAIPFVRQKLTLEGDIVDEELRTKLKGIVQALAGLITQNRNAAGS